MRRSSFPVLAFAVLSLALSAPLARADDGGPGVVAKPAANDAAAKPHADKPVRQQKGIASYYGKKFNHKKTASGVPLDPNQKTAASKTLPIGTKAEVTNTENGKKTEVVVTDRGPYVKDRIIDVTPKA